MKQTRFLTWLLFVTAGVSLLLFLQWKLELHWGTAALAQVSNLTHQNLTNNSPLTPVLKKETQEHTVHSDGFDIKIKIKTEAEKIAQIDPSPETTDQNLNQLALSLTENDLKELKSLIFSDNQDGDQVALSLDLLGRTNFRLASEILSEYILSSSNVVQREINTFRLLALDSLIDQSLRDQNPSYLRQIKNRTDDAFIAKRAEQAIKALHGKAKTPAETDTQGLQKLLESESSTHSQRGS